MLSGFVFIEAVVELRGCGVTFGQMNPVAFLLFIPALVGRLATGVLTQQQKVGVVSESVYPEEWRTGPTWQQHAARTLDMLHLDKDFVSLLNSSAHSFRCASQPGPPGARFALQSPPSLARRPFPVRRHPRFEQQLSVTTDPNVFLSPLRCSR